MTKTNQIERRTDEYGYDYDIYYHVAPSSYDGGSLYCRRELELRDIPYRHKWSDECTPEDYPDSEIICLFEAIKDARDFVQEFEPKGKILRVRIYPDERTVIRNEEGYPCVFGSINQEYITEAQK